MDLYKDLKDFYKKLRSYQNRQVRRNKGEFTEAQDRSLNALRQELLRDYGRLSDALTKQENISVIPYSEDSKVVFSAALGSLNMDATAFQGLDVAINIVNAVIGRLEAEGNSWYAISERPEHSKRNLLQWLKHALDYLWQVTVKNAVEGIVSGLKKP